MFIGCTCKDYKFRFQYIATKERYNALQAQLVPATQTNPNNDQGAGCKHILKVLDDKVIVEGVNILGVEGTYSASGGVEDDLVNRTITTYTNNRVTSVGEYAFYNHKKNLLQICGQYGHPDHWNNHRHLHHPEAVHQEDPRVL